MKKLKVLSLFFIIFILGAWLDPFQDEVNQGNQKFSEKDFSTSKEHYNQAEKHAPNQKDKSKLAFNKGAADYMAEDYDSAIANFKKSLQSEDPEVQKKAFLNMGNAYVKKGDTKEAINSYINALKIDPNYEKVKKNIEYLLKPQQQQDQKQQQNKDQDKNDEQKQKQSQAQMSPENQGEEKDDPKSKDQEQQQKVAKKMSKEQIKKILEAMKKKSVQRKKGDPNGTRSLEKNW